MFTKYSDFLNEMSGGDRFAEFVRANTYMDLEDVENGVYLLSTRRNGNVGAEIAGAADKAEARRLASLVKKEYPNAKVWMEEVDEWVHLNVELEPKPAEDVYKYSFVKDIEGRGFTSGGFDTMDELIDEYGDWIDVDWDEVKTRVDAINDFPENSFTGWYRSRRMLIKRAGEPGNKWGYNFYIVKSKLKED